MNIASRIHTVLDSHLFTPVRTSPLASATSRKIIEFADMCITQLPPISKLRYIRDAAKSGVPNRPAANE